MDEIDSRLRYSHTMAVGVDLGQSKDPTSIAVVEKISAVPAPNTPEHHVAAVRALARTVRPRYHLRLLEQAPLGMAYPAQAHMLKSILACQDIAKHDPRVWIDYTGVGRAVYDIFMTERVPRIMPVTITFGGQAGPNGRGGHNVPKGELVSNLQAFMHSGKLLMPDTLPMVKTFRRELQDFRVGYTAVGNATFGAREGAHDDLILAVALAVYGLDSGREIIVEPLRV